MKFEEKTEATKKSAQKQDALEDVRKMLSWKQLLSIIPLSRTTLEIEIKEGRFPKPYPLSSLKVGFFHDEVVEWQKNLVKGEG